jgi:hypothetical protein
MTIAALVLFLKVVSAVGLRPDAYNSIVPALIASAWIPFVFPARFQPPTQFKDLRLLLFELLLQANRMGALHCPAPKF